MPNTALLHALQWAQSKVWQNFYGAMCMLQIQCKIMPDCSTYYSSPGYFCHFWTNFTLFTSSERRRYVFHKALYFLLKIFVSHSSSRKWPMENLLTWSGMTCNDRLQLYSFKIAPASAGLIFNILQHQRMAEMSYRMNMHTFSLFKFCLLSWIIATYRHKLS